MYYGNKPVGVSTHGKIIHLVVTLQHTELKIKTDSYITLLCLNVLWTKL